MSGEGFKLAIVLIACFMTIALASIYMIIEKQMGLEVLTELFTGLGTLAAMFGLPAIITAWIVTRGQTSQPEEVKEQA